MKTFIEPTLILFLLLECSTMNLSAQISTFCNYENAPLRFKPDAGNVKVRLPKNDKITVIAKTNSHSLSGSPFYKVVFKTDTGYLAETFVGIENHKMFRKLSQLPIEDNANDTLNYQVPIYTAPTLYTDATPSGARIIYGTEDNKSEYQSGNYDSITLTWYCSNGKYRSITYIFKEAQYIKESEYTSDCVQ